MDAGLETEDASGIGVCLASEELDEIVLDDELEQADDHLDNVDHQTLEREFTVLEVEDDYIICLSLQCKLIVD